MLGLCFRMTSLGLVYSFTQPPVMLAGLLGVVQNAPSFAEFERAMIVERVNSGLAKANARRSISRKPIARLSLRGASADSTAL